VEIIKHPDRNFWWKVASSCEYATFLQSPLWTELVCRSYDNLREATIGAVLDSGTRLVLPLVEAPSARGTMRALESTWNWSPGGVIADGPVEAAEIESLYRSLRSWRLGEAVFTGNPHSPLPDPLRQRGWKVQEDFSQILPLSGDLDSIVGGFERRHRKALRSATRAGVTVRRGGSLEDYEAHYQAYLASYERWSAKWAPALPWRLFETCHTMSVENPNHVALWLAEVDGGFASGAILFYWNRFVVAWHAAAHEEFFKYSPNNALHPEIMRDALDRGMSCYDFNPSGGQDGVVNFKAGFGAQKRFFKRATYSHRVLSLIRALGKGLSK
jgi:hypothetical protein